MGIVYFPSVAEADIIEVAFATKIGEDLNLPLLVDSGFCGASSFVLSKNLAHLASLPAASTNAIGALQGKQQRIVVFCGIPAISFKTTETAILADLATMALPEGIRGIVGLRFLRQFRRWGAEFAEGGGWRFFLES